MRAGEETEADTLERDPPVVAAQWATPQEEEEESVVAEASPANPEECCGQVRAGSQRALRVQACYCHLA
jgi:hypothetical protein